MVPSPARGRGQQTVPSPARGREQQMVPSPARGREQQMVPSPARGGLGWGEIEQEDTQISYAKLSNSVIMFFKRIFVNASCKLVVK
jgi:hypothetical protein